MPTNNDERDRSTRDLARLRETIKLLRDMSEEDLNNIRDTIAGNARRLDELEKIVYKSPDSLQVNLARNNQRDDSQDALHGEYKKIMNDMDNNNRSNTGSFAMVQWLWDKARESGAVKAAAVVVFLVWALYLDGCNRTMTLIEVLATGQPQSMHVETVNVDDFKVGDPETQESEEAPQDTLR